MSLVKTENIKAEMARKNISYALMAKTLKLSYQGFYHKINGKRKFTADEIYVLSNVLNVEIEYFFN